mmetsp:Transcript_18035/g.61471  ORF Transcript_18035/g.61471 Transcript_18035/m.61471 type:complete len:82 (+) Transcript_18035:1731-1976(+)
MPSPGFYGAVFGFATALLSNSIRRVPLMREPWVHVGAAGAGYYANEWLHEYTARTIKEVEMLELRRQMMGAKTKGMYKPGP